MPVYNNNGISGHE